MTRSQEGYLKIIYENNLKKIKLTNKSLAQAMEVSPPSAWEMIDKLLKAGLIKRDEALGFSLSQAGKEKTQLILKKHRLWEVFLIDHLGYSWDEVHEDAVFLEHVTSDRLEERLNDFLGRPKFCPHGKIIYGNSSDNDQELVSLASLRPGFKGRVLAIDDDSKLLVYLEKKGLVIGSHIELLAIDDYDGSFKIKLDSEKVDLAAKAGPSIYLL